MTDTERNVSSEKERDQHICWYNLWAISSFLLYSRGK